MSSPTTFHFSLSPSDVRHRLRYSLHIQEQQQEDRILDVFLYDIIIEQRCNCTDSEHHVTFKCPLTLEFPLESYENPDLLLHDGLYSLARMEEMPLELVQLYFQQYAFVNHPPYD